MAKETTSPEAKAPAVQKPEEPEYTVAEFAVNAKHLFGNNANSDIVYAAFLVKGINKATLAAAKETVTAFMQKEVK